MFLFVLHHCILAPNGLVLFLNFFVLDLDSFALGLSFLGDLVVFVSEVDDLSFEPVNLTVFEVGSCGNRFSGCSHVEFEFDDLGLERTNLMVPGLSNFESFVLGLVRLLCKLAIFICFVFDRD